VSKITALTEYLTREDGFLLSDRHNGKTIMLSGFWGVGKTHFWKNIVEPVVSKKLLENESACVYVSLYGKDNLEALKNEILFKAYSFQNKASKTDDITSKAISVFGFTSRIISSSLSIGDLAKIDSSEISDSIKGFFESKKIQKAEEYINNGGVICLDDFERKSRNIDLNDLFGFISQLSIELNCKVVIILNSDSFEGKERNIFKQVKEKTINKFFMYSPTIEELFNVIFTTPKYKNLTAHKTTILEVIKESKELNARIYIQVLDNCLEWISSGFSSSSLRALILSTINFIKNHFIFDKTITCEGTGREVYKICMKSKNYYEIVMFLTEQMPGLSGGVDNVIHQMRGSINNRKETESSSTSNKTVQTKADQHYYELNKKFNDNISTYEAIYFYGYYLKIEEGATQEEFRKIISFVESGVLNKS